MTLSRSPMTASVSQTFCQFHDASGLSWSGTIILSTFAVRKQRELYRLEVIRRNCAASKIYLPNFLQIPLWVTISVALRNLSTGGGFIKDQSALAEATTRQGQLSTEGFGWVTDLTLPDPIWIIPVTVGSLFLINNEIAGAKISREVLTQGGQKPLPKRHMLLTNFLRCLALAMVPISAQVPTAVALYWTSSVTAGIVVNLVLLSPKFRRAVKIPVTREESSNPYRNVLTNMKDNAWRSVQWTKQLGPGAKLGPKK